MDHADARRLIDEAALEPDGLERLVSGDTAESAVLTGHLVECEDCTRELAAAQRIAQALRLVAEETPSANLRERTLAMVRAVGRPRGAEAITGAEGAAEGRAPVPGATGAPATVPARRFALVAIAAAVAFALLAAGSFVAADLQGRLDRTRQEALRLRELYGDVESVLHQPSTRIVALRGEGGLGQGTLVADPASNRLAVIADGLPSPALGMEYRCWVEIAGARRPIGRMWFADGLAYWAGDAAGIARWPKGTVFGVSLEAVGAAGAGAPVLLGEL